MFVLAILVIQELNVILSVVLERNPMIFLFVLEKGNVFLQTNANAAVDLLELNVICRDVD
jgi:hypothetical protein